GGGGRGVGGGGGGGRQAGGDADRRGHGRSGQHHRTGRHGGAGGRVAARLLRHRLHDAAHPRLRSAERRPRLWPRADPSDTRRGSPPRPSSCGPGVTTFLAVVGSVTPPGRLTAAIASAVEMAAARPGVSASLLNLADYRVSFADGRPPEKFDDDTGRVVARMAGADCVLLSSPVYRGTF